MRKKELIESELLNWRILKEVAVKSLSAEHANGILIENKSINCGENASEALKVIKKWGR